MKGILLLLVLVAGCCKSQPDAVRPEIQAVYSGPVTSDPLAHRLCVALHVLPSQRLDACCHRGGMHVEAECTRALSAALATSAVALSESRVEACEAAMNSELSGCAWVGPNPLPRPAACEAIIEGKLDLSERCRSSLECKAGLSCRAAGPTDWGTCQPPAVDGVGCGLSVDTLATYTRQRMEGQHDECRGVCERHRCGPGKTTCTSSVQCPSNHHCSAEGACENGAHAGEHESCVPGACAGNLRCQKGRCAPPLGTGAECASNLECRGSCAQGLCVESCS